MNNLTVVNNGKERASYSVVFEGHVDAENNSIGISKRSIDALKNMSDMAKQFGGDSAKLEKTLTERLAGFPSGTEVKDYLETNGLSIFDYIENASTLLNSVAKASGTGTRAKRGEGHTTKANKYLEAVLAKLACRFAPASGNGTVTDEMLTEGLNKAIEAIKTTGESKLTELITSARETAERAGLDLNGFIRLRSDKSEKETDEE